MHYPYTTLHSHQPLSPSLPFSSFLPSYLSSFQDPWRGLLTKRCYIARCRPGDNLSPLHFVNSFPRGAIRLPRPSTSRFYLSLILPFVHCLSRFPLRHPVRSPISFSLSPLLFLSGYPAKRARYPFRADIPWRIPGTKAATIPREYVGETRNVKRARSLLHPALPSSSASAYPIVSPPSLFLCFSVSLSFSLALHLFVSRPLLSPTTYCHHVFPPHSLFLSCDRSLSTPVPRVLPRPPKGGGPGDETDPTRISGAIEAN